MTFLFKHFARFTTVVVNINIMQHFSALSFQEVFIDKLTNYLNMERSL